MDEKATPATGTQGPDESARSVFLAWEKLRLVYNGVLAGIVLLLAGPRLQEPAFWVFLSQGVVFANLCFCAGPCAEGYMVLLVKADRFGARCLVFGGGLVLASAMTLYTMVFWGPMGGFMS
jgi:hypothetical protein